jgi:hypothetical protein
LVLIGWVDLVFLIWLLGCEDDGRCLLYRLFVLQLSSDAFLFFSNHGLRCI